jgi:hypothetical protein
MPYLSGSDLYLFFRTVEARTAFRWIPMYYFASGEWFVEQQGRLNSQQLKDLSDELAAHSH